MPTRSQPRSQIANRSRWARSSGQLTVNDPDGWVSDGNHGPVWWYGLDAAGGSPIGPNGPWQAFGPAQAVVTRATSLICGPLSAAPYRIQDLAELGADSPAPRWLTDPMLLRPDARFATAIYPAVLTLSRSAFWSHFVRSALWCGIGAFLCLDDEAGQPLAGSLRLVDPRLLTTERDPEDGSLRWVIDAGSYQSERAVFGRDGKLQLGPLVYRLVVMRNPLSPIDAEGRSSGVFELSPGAFQLGASIETYAAGTFRSGIPAGYLQVETPGLTDTQAAELKAKWMSNHGGDRRSIAVLNATTRFQPLNLSPVDAALDATKRLNIGDVAYAFGLDPLTLGVSMGNSSTYQNVMAAWTTHRDYGLSPWISALQDCLSALLAGTSGVLVNLDSFANPPLKDRVATGAAAVKAGLLTADEWRATEGLAPLPKPEIPPALEAFQEEPQPEQPAPELEPSPERLLKIQPWKRAGGTA